MAGTLLHITIADIARKRATISATMRNILESFAADYRLGAIFFDLPYYENLAVQGMLRMTPADYIFGKWGEALHTRSPKALCLQLLASADRPAACAAAVGALTHAAVDAVFHPEIERRVNASNEGRARPNRMHHLLETWMDVHLHTRLIGGPGIGTPYMRQVLDLTPNPGWERFFNRSISQVHGTDPGRRRMRAWLRGVRIFGVLHAVPGFPGTRIRPVLDVERDETAEKLFDSAVIRCVRYIELGCAYLSHAAELDTVFAAIPDTDLATGAAAHPSVCPGI